MYTDHEGQEQDLQKKDVMNCLDQEQMQAMQDQFCQTQGVYCVCVSRNMRRLTSFSGTKEEQNFIDRVFPVATQRNLIASFSDVGGEDVIAVESSMPCVQLRGIAIRDEDGRFDGAWVLVAIDAECIRPEDQVPQIMRKTTTKAFDAAVALLDVLTKLFFQQDPSGCAGRGDRPVRSKRKAHGVSFAKDRGADRDLKDDGIGCHFCTDHGRYIGARGNLYASVQWQSFEIAGGRRTCRDDL